MKASSSPWLFRLGFIAPAFVLYVGFVIWPLIQAFQISFYRWRGTSNRVTWVGMENYEKLRTDPVLSEALGNNLFMMFVGGVLIVILALLVAHALQKSTRVSQFLESIYLFPQVVSMVVVALLWQFMFNPQFGPVPLLQKALGLGEFQSGWLATPNVALPAVTVAFAWYAVGFYVMLFSAGLRQIPTEITEASELDGSTGWHRFTNVTWPLLWSVKRTGVTYLVITVMNTFALVYLMTKGQPDRKTKAALTYLYEQAFTNSDWGYASALAVVNLFFVMAVTLLVMWIFRRDPTERRARA